MVHLVNIGSVSCSGSAFVHEIEYRIFLPIEKLLREDAFQGGPGVETAKLLYL